MVCNNIDFRHRAYSRVAAHERLGDRFDLIVAEILEVLDLAAGDGVKEHPCVHCWAEEKRLFNVPGASDARQEIVANSRTHLAQRVGVERSNDEDVGPFH